MTEVYGLAVILVICVIGVLRLELWLLAYFLALPHLGNSVLWIFFIGNKLTSNSIELVGIETRRHFIHDKNQMRVSWVYLKAAL